MQNDLPSNPIIDRLPKHLRSYIHPQHYAHYSAVDQILEPLKLKDDECCIIVTAANQSTGSSQSIFYAEKVGYEVSVDQIALVFGNALDIDAWHIANFSHILIA